VVSELDDAAKRHIDSLTLDASLRERYELKIASLQSELAARPDAESIEPPQDFDVTFALNGPLGLEFKDTLKPPYIVQFIHNNCVASNLNIEPGDELMQIAHSDVPQKWDAMVQKMQTRPVIATFRRGKRKNTNVLTKMGFWGKSSSDSVDKELLEVKRQRDEAQKLVASTETVLANMMQGGVEATVNSALEKQEMAEAQVQMLEIALEAERTKQGGMEQQHTSLLQQCTH